MRALISALVAAVLLLGAPAQASPGHRPGPIRLSAGEVLEDAVPGTEVGVLSATDKDRGDSHTFALVPGTGDRSNALLSISGDRLLVAGALDHETTPVLSVRVRVTDADGLTRERSFHLSVTDVNEAPTAITLTPDSIAEGVWGGTVGTLVATDEDTPDAHVFELVAGAGDTDNGLFAIAGDQLRSVTVFDFEKRSTYSVRVRTTDAADATYEQQLTVHVIDVPDLNHAPTGVTIDHDQVSRSGSNLIGTLTAIDPDPGDTHTFSLVNVTYGMSGFGNYFSITGNGLYVHPSCGLPNGGFVATVEVTDQGGLSVQATIPITVTNAPPRSPGARRC